MLWNGTAEWKLLVTVEEWDRRMVTAVVMEGGSGCTEPRMEENVALETIDTLS